MILHVSPMLCRLQRRVRRRVTPCLVMWRQDEVTPLALLVIHSRCPACLRGRSVVYLTPASLLCVLGWFGD